MKGGKKNPEEFAQGSLKQGDKKVPNTTVFSMSESHKVMNYFMKTTWNISQCQNVFHIYVQILTEITMVRVSKLEPQCYGNTTLTIRQNIPMMSSPGLLLSSS